jgi:hypothetical protein
VHHPGLSTIRLRDRPMPDTPPPRLALPSWHPNSRWWLA